MKKPPIHSKRLQERIMSAGGDTLGAQLGRLCVLHNYTVDEVAEVFSVSRQTVYNWMLGKNKPQSIHLATMKRLVEHLQAKPLPEINADTI